jgi:hypothetical protein
MGRDVIVDLCCGPPPIGATVHYVNANSFGETRVPCLPAIVTDYYYDEIELFVINHGDTFVAQAAHDHQLEAHTWHSASPAACDGGFARR